MIYRVDCHQRIDDALWNGLKVNDGAERKQWSKHGALGDTKGKLNFRRKDIFQLDLLTPARQV